MPSRPGSHTPLWHDGPCPPSVPGRPAPSSTFPPYPVMVRPDSCHPPPLHFFPISPVTSCYTPIINTERKFSKICNLGQTLLGQLSEIIWDNCPISAVLTTRPTIVWEGGKKKIPQAKQKIDKSQMQVFRLTFGAVLGMSLRNVTFESLGSNLASDCRQ